MVDHWFRQRIENYVWRWAELLKLRHFEIVIVWPEDYSRWPETDDNWPNFKESSHDFAATFRSKNYEHARLYFNEALLARIGDDRLVEATVVHELLHIVCKDVEGVLDLIDGQLHRDVDSIVTEAFGNAHEAVIDRLAYRLVDIRRAFDTN